MTAGIVHIGGGGFTARTRRSTSTASSREVPWTRASHGPQRLEQVEGSAGGQFHADDFKRRTETVAA